MPTPVGRPCAHCWEPITAVDRGELVSSVRLMGHALTVQPWPAHYECGIRVAVGCLPSFYGGGPPWRGSFHDEARHIVSAINDLRRATNLSPL